VAEVAVVYANMSTRSSDDLHDRVVARLSDSPAEVTENVANAVMAQAVMQVATLNNAKAVALRDEGRQEEAQQALQYNATLLRQQAVQFDSDQLADYAKQNDTDADNLDASSWKRQRKVMRDVQFKNQNQRSY